MLRISSLVLPPIFAACANPSPKDSDPSAEIAADLSVTVHPEVNTVLLASWTQQEASEASWVEVAFGDTVLQTPVLSRPAGPASASLLGIPADTEVRVTVINEDGERFRSAELVASTGSLPADLPEPELLVWDPSRASPEPWVMLTVDVGEVWFKGPFYAVILNREGRVVWYWQVPDERTSLYAQPGWDGQHLVMDGNATYVFDDSVESKIYRLTLDLARLDEIEIPDLLFSFEEETNGAVLYGRHQDDGSWTLARHAADGTDTDLWSCGDRFSGSLFLDQACFNNTLVWDAERNTAMYSMQLVNTVFEIELSTGEIVREFGASAEGWSVEPETAPLSLQHYPNWTPDGTILLSTRVPDAPGETRAREYEVDDDSQTLTERWSYGEDHYASQEGEAVRLENGNTLIGYGTGGALVEVSPGGELLWELAWPENAETGTTLIGHATLLGDLHALNGS